MSGPSSLGSLRHSISGPKVLPYKYEPLTAGQIRLLQLNPANEETDPLNGDLVAKNLGELPPSRSSSNSGPPEPIDPDKHVCFEAISYVWGSATFTDSFNTSQGSIPITASLASILRRLRGSTEPRLLWADGLCINQSDIAEKEVQVALMGVIYSSAVRVLCDLGEETEELSRLLDAMDRYWKRNIRYGALLNQSSSMFMSGESTAKVLGIPFPTNEEADAIEEVKGEQWPELYLKLVSLPWFHRVWIVQEFVLGREVSMLFGRRHISWAELLAGTQTYKNVEFPWFSPSILATNPDLITTFMSYGIMCYVRISRHLDLSTPHGRQFKQVALSGLSLTSLPPLLMLFSHHGVTVPRDRYFAFLGMMDEKDVKAMDFRPDYSSPLREVTIKFWSHALQMDLGRELIFGAGLPGLTKGYPSWLRDITAPNPFSHVWIERPLVTQCHQAGGPAETWSVVVSNHDPDQLLVQGHYIDNITHESPLEPSGPLDLKWLAHRLHQAFTLMPETNKRYPLTDEYVHEAVLKAVLDFNKEDTVASGNKGFEAIFQLGLSLLQIFSDAAEGEALEEKVGSAFQDMSIVQELWSRLCRADRHYYAEAASPRWIQCHFVRKTTYRWRLVGIRSKSWMDYSVGYDYCKYQQIYLWVYGLSHTRQQVTRKLDDMLMLTGAEYPVYLSSWDYQEFMQSYAEHFKLNKHITFNTSVKSVNRNSQDDGWEVHLEKVDSGEVESRPFDKVVFCHGYQTQKVMPTFPGQETYEGEIIHSQQYRGSEPYQDKTVVFLGLSTTTDELAPLVIPVAKKVYVSHRSGQIVIKRVRKGRPTDLLVSWRRRQITQWIARCYPNCWRMVAGWGAKLLSNQYAEGKIDPAWRLGQFRNPTLKLPGLIQHLIPHFQDGSLTSLHGIKRFLGGKSIEFEDGTVLDDVDSVIFTTGYRGDFSVAPFVEKSTPKSHGYQGPPIQRLFMNVFPPKYADSCAMLCYSAYGKNNGFSFSDVMNMAISNLWRGVSNLPSYEEMEEWVDQHQEWVAANWAREPHVDVSMVKQYEFQPWMHEKAGTGMENLGWGWAGWKFWWKDRKMYNLMNHGVETAHMFRYFETGKRSTWKGAREEIIRQNRIIEENFSGKNKLRLE
ncbi:hypothetical protein F53441_11925 [Fusarium austroafricanum]|uniref:Heterokaryon incompatibility domain-containing protein n=1 Tax=Fusarium austroafricanum TaxID=2364996 RepID=A0A8H4NNM6_9HYPO|nr:hypothetical protein F53441_11925 [Fusarium austroafricanum]